MSAPYWGVQAGWRGEILRKRSQAGFLLFLLSSVDEKSIAVAFDRTIKHDSIHTQLKQ